MSTRPVRLLTYTGCSARMGTDCKDLRALLAQLRNKRQKKTTGNEEGAIWGTTKLILNCNCYRPTSAYVPVVEGCSI
jgi:hypothetical protein